MSSFQVGSDGTALYRLYHSSRPGKVIYCYSFAPGHKTAVMSRNRSETNLRTVGKA